MMTDRTDMTQSVPLPQDDVTLATIISCLHHQDALGIARVSQRFNYFITKTLNLQYISLTGVYRYDDPRRGGNCYVYRMIKDTINPPRRDFYKDVDEAIVDYCVHDPNGPMADEFKRDDGENATDKRWYTKGALPYVKDSSFLALRDDRYMVYLTRPYGKRCLRISAYRWLARSTYTPHVDVYVDYVYGNFQGISVEGLLAAEETDVPLSCKHFEGHGNGWNHLICGHISLQRLIRTLKIDRGYLYDDASHVIDGDATHIADMTGVGLFINVIADKIPHNDHKTRMEESMYGHGEQFITHVGIVGDDGSLQFFDDDGPCEKKMIFDALTIDKVLSYLTPNDMLSTALASSDFYRVFADHTDREYRIVDVRGWRVHGSVLYMSDGRRRQHHETMCGQDLVFTYGEGIGHYEDDERSGLIWYHLRHSHHIILEKDTSYIFTIPQKTLLSTWIYCCVFHYIRGEDNDWVALGIHSTTNGCSGRKVYVSRVIFEWAIEEVPGYDCQGDGNGGTVVTRKLAKIPLPSDRMIEVGNFIALHIASPTQYRYRFSVPGELTIRKKRDSEMCVCRIHGNAYISHVNVLPAMDRGTSL